MLFPTFFKAFCPPLQGSNWLKWATYRCKKKRAETGPSRMRPTKFRRGSYFHGARGEGGGGRKSLGGLPSSGRKIRLNGALLRSTLRVRSMMIRAGNGEERKGEARRREGRSLDRGLRGKRWKLENRGDMLERGGERGEQEETRKERKEDGKRPGTATWHDQQRDTNKHGSSHGQHYLQHI